MRILLTGGAGFIGSHATLLLLQEGHEIVVLDSFVNSTLKVFTRIKSYLESLDISYDLIVIRGDIRNKNTLDDVFKNCIKEGKPIQAVMHFAGLKSVSESVCAPLEYWDVNVCGTKNLLAIMKKNECYSIVFSSSATIYGLSNSIPIKEDHQISPINPYGQTKAAIEFMLRDLYKSDVNLWRICSLRYFNPVGAHPSSFIGEDPKGIPNNLFPFITQVAVGKRNHVCVFGNDWDTKDGSGIRDYIHVMDLVEGHLSALKYLLSKSNTYETINLGSGIGYSVFEIIKQFEILNGGNISHKVVGRRIGDIPVSVADIGKANKLLKWSPTRSLCDMCLDGLNWQRKNTNGVNSIPKR